jgi:hypothetical protein
VPFRPRRLVIGLAAAACGLAVAAAPASAGPLVASAGDCAPQSLSKPFLPWGDIADYTPLGGGDFESAAAGWSLSSGASVTGGGSSYFGGSSALTLPAGSSATSPAICVGIEHPTMRFFVKRASGGLLTTGMRVEVLFEDAGGTVRDLTIGLTGAITSWQPTIPYPLIANLLAPEGDRTPVAFRFTALGGTMAVDDVYVDPYSRK